ncbi:MAG: CHAP domain-containing protein [Eubacteriales bacterium]|nr:CHAP domain-containing protein [Eubacteriales bacterium]
MIFKNRMKKLLVFGTLLMIIPVTAHGQNTVGQVMTEGSTEVATEAPETPTQPETPVAPETPTESEASEIPNAPNSDTVSAVKKAIPTLSGTASYSLQYKSKKKFTLNVKSSGTATLKYSSNNTSVAKVSSKGVVTLTGVGKCVITVISPANSRYASTSKSIRVSSWKRAKSIGYSASYKRSKFYKNLRNLKLLNNKRDNIISIANSQVGYREGNSSKVLTGAKKGSHNYTEFGRYYGLNGEPWCAIFVNWVARETGISYSVVPKRCAVRDYYSFFRSRGLAHPWSQVRTGSYKPKKGDIIFYSYSPGDTTHHIGYVESCSYTVNSLTLNVIEGNAKDAVCHITMTLKRANASGKIRDFYITGIASPRY